MTDHITLTGFTDYNPSYPPRDPKKGYVAKITGRAAGARKYEREFLGETVDLVEGDEGLYERQRGDKKGGYTRWYHVILSHTEHGLIKSTDCEDDVARIAKLLDDGHAIEDIVEVVDLRPSERTEGLMIFDVGVRSTGDIRKHRASATIESATEECWKTLSLLPEKEAKKVLTALKKRLTPPKPAPAEETPESPEE